jgi:teichuronic acid exporter
MTGKQTIRGSSKWLVGSNVSVQVAEFLMGIVLARLLVPADFGMMVTIQLLTGMVSLVATGGMGQALIRSKEASSRDFHAVFTVQLFIGIAICAVLFTIAPTFAAWFDELLLKDLLRISAVGFLLRPLMNLHLTWLQREMRFKETAIRSGFASLLSGLVSIILAALGAGVWSLAIGGLASSLASYVLVRRLTPMSAHVAFDRAIVSRHAGYGSKLIVNELISYIRRQTANLLIAKISGNAAVGIFNKADSLSKLPFTLISGPVYQPVFRAMSVAQDDPETIKYLYYRMASLLLLYTLPIYVGLWWLAEPFILVVFGKHWAETAHVLEILAPLGLLYCFGHPAGAVLAATDRLGREMIVHGVTWVLVGSGVFVGLRWGIKGAAWGVVLSQIYSNIHMFMLANGCFQASVREVWRAIAPGILLNSMLVGVLFGVDQMLEIWAPGIGSIAYLLTSSVCGAVAYAALFLILPMGAISDEADRWRKLILKGRPA